MRVSTILPSAIDSVAMLRLRFGCEVKIPAVRRWKTPSQSGQVWARISFSTSPALRAVSVAIRPSRISQTTPTRAWSPSPSR